MIVLKDRQRIVHILEIDTASAFSALKTRYVSEIKLKHYPWLTLVCILEDLHSGQNDDKARATSCGVGGNDSAPNTIKFRKQP